MRVAELYQFHTFRLMEQPEPTPGPGEVLVRVTAVGICGSDLHNFSVGAVGDMPSVYPMVLGHEPAGTVVKTGAGVTGWQPGDRALLEPAIYCYHCQYCLSGRHNVCANLRFLSQPNDPGFFRDYVVLPAGNLLPLPSHLSEDEGTLFEPLAVVLHSMKFAQLQPGETAAVYGAGPIGLLTIAVLRLCGALRIFAVEPVAERREMALRAGAHAVIDPCQVEPAAQIRSETGGEGVDLVLDCATRGDSLTWSIRSVRKAGRLVVTGIPWDAKVYVDLHELRRKEVHLFNVRRSNHESEAALHLMKEHPKIFGAMVTHRFPLEQVQEAFLMLEAYSGGAGKIVMRLA